jgi:bifunctional non-homologous end joining protein LigD
VLRYSDHVAGAGADFFAHACKLGLEGIVSKKRDAPYRGTRGPEWLKIKCLKQQEIVIGGYTEPEGSRIGIGALLGGVYESGHLVYVGKIGTGFDNRMLRDLQQRLSRLEQKTSPFASRPAGAARAHWVKPELVAQVSFSEWTSDGKLRHPAFQGLREDKPADSVVRERPATTEDEMKRTAPARRSSRPAKATAEAVVAGVRLTHADRVLYPSHGTTKLDLARFYESIAKWILPHLEDRPTTLVRCPEGAHKTCFYQKHVGYWAPESLRRVKIQEKRKVGEYLVVDSLASLIGLVQIGILEIHTWNSVVKRLEQPDRVVFDLDPGPGVEWAQVVECARVIREALHTLELESFVKTTGGKGLHVVAPLVRGPSWDEASAFARAFADTVARANPRRYITSMAKAERRANLHRLFTQYPRGRGVAPTPTRARRKRRSVPLHLGRAVHRDHVGSFHDRERATSAGRAHRGSLGGLLAHPAVPSAECGSAGVRALDFRQETQHGAVHLRAIPCAPQQRERRGEGVAGRDRSFERGARLLEHRGLSLDPRSPAVLHPLALEGRDGVRDSRWLAAYRALPGTRRAADRSSARHHPRRANRGMDAVLTLTDAPTAEQQRVIGSGLAKFNAEQAGYSDSRDLAVLVSDPATQQVVGGLLGRTSLGILFVDLFYVPDEPVDLKGARRLLDVGGGSGAFSITLCRRFPELRATILDFPSVQAATTAFVREAGMSERIEFIPGNALTTEWPAGQDVVLLSYLLSAVSSTGVDQLLARAFAVLSPGSRIVLHDFMVDDDGSGPATAALWLGECTADRSRCCSALARPPGNAPARSGVRARHAEVIPGITRSLTAVKRDR